MSDIEKIVDMEWAKLPMEQKKVYEELGTTT
jgi:hypothetical protein